MHRIISQDEAGGATLTERSQDPTAPKGMEFHHAKQGRPLSTPWQVATIRSLMLTETNLADGWLLDCACGSGIQLIAHASVLNRRAVGIELDEERAMASAMNFLTVAQHQDAEGLPWYGESRILVGDGTDAAGAMEALGGHEEGIALLHLDPARPRNSRTHDLSEMQPPLDAVFRSWAPYFSEHPKGPALLLDLSPRLTETQRMEVEALVDAVWPQIERTWVWTSRGRGRVDRLALWLGAAALGPDKRRFVRVPPQLGDGALIISSTRHTPPLECLFHPPQRGEFVSILDAALIESGLAVSWLSDVSAEVMTRWAVIEGRRPQLHHKAPLRLDKADNLLVQATGKVVELLPFDLDDATVDRVVEAALENNMASVKIRMDTPPEKQPRWQGSLDRQLARRHGTKEGFLVRHPGGDVLLLCVCHSESS